jgi:hypothetical protein
MPSGIRRWLLLLEKAINEKVGKVIKIKIEVMKEGKKDTYWGTSVRRFVASGKDKFCEYGFIYINIKDSATKEKLADVVMHELEHLVDDKQLLKSAIDIVNEATIKK